MEKKQKKKPTLWPLLSWRKTLRFFQVTLRVVKLKVVNSSMWHTTLGAHLPSSLVNWCYAIPAHESKSHPAKQVTGPNCSWSPKLILDLYHHLLRAQLCSRLQSRELLFRGIIPMFNPKFSLFLSSFSTPKQENLYISPTTGPQQTWLIEFSC